MYGIMNRLHMASSCALSVKLSTQPNTLVVLRSWTALLCQGPTQFTMFARGL
jgi:hypothetical protein